MLLNFQCDAILDDNIISTFLGCKYSEESRFFAGNKRNNRKTPELLKMIVLY